MKDLLGKIQKDLKLLQATIEKEGNDLLIKAKKAVNDIATSKNVANKTRELEKLIESKFSKFEPAFYKFVGQVAKNANKYGLDVGDLEKIVRTSVKKAKSSLGTKAKTAKTTVKAAVKKSNAKKTAKQKKSNASSSSGSSQS